MATPRTTTHPHQTKPIRLNHAFRRIPIPGLLTFHRQIFTIDKTKALQNKSFAALSPLCHFSTPSRSQRINRIGQKHHHPTYYKTESNIKNYGSNRQYTKNFRITYNPEHSQKQQRHAQRKCRAPPMLCKSEYSRRNDNSYKRRHCDVLEVGRNRRFFPTHIMRIVKRRKPRHAQHALLRYESRKRESAVQPHQDLEKLHLQHPRHQGERRQAVCRQHVILPHQESQHPV